MQSDDNVGAQLIERGRGVAVWKQIAEELQQSIAHGTLSAGDQLPTEVELAERFRVNRHTVRRALSVLANEGYVEATRGRGTFVAQRPISYPLTSRTRFSEIVSSQDLQPGGRLISSQTEGADERLSHELEVPLDEPLLRLETLRVAQGQPLVLATSWFVLKLAPNLIADYAETGSITQALERAGHADYRRRASWISASSASQEDAGYLRLEKNAPVLVVESMNVTANNLPIQFSRARFVPESVRLFVET